MRDRDCNARAHPHLQTLEDAIALGMDIVDVIVQDEYTHDVIVRRASDYLVLDAT